MPAPPVTPAGSSNPARLAVAVTPSDSADLGTAANALWIGGAGNVNVDMLDGGTVLFSGVQAGTVLPVMVRRVRSTSTTATSIVALYF